MRWRAVFVASAFLLAGTPSFAKGPFGSIHVGQWKGGAYTDDRTGAFTHCAAGGQYVNGIYVLFSQNVDGSWTIGLANNVYDMVVGSPVPITVIFDGQAQFRLFGNAFSSKAVGAPLPGSAFLNQLRKSHLMVVEMRQETFQFKLPSTGQLIATIENCVARTKSAGISKAGDFSVTKQVVQSLPEPTSPSKPPKMVVQAGSGFVVSPTGHIVTNNHVIKGCAGDIHGSLAGESAAVLRVVSTDETNDLALLQAPNTFNEIAKIRGAAIHSGDAVIAIGYPFHGLLTSDFTVTAGIVSSLSGILNDTRFLQISAGVQPGNSGGPLFDTNGSVVGVVSSKINALKFAKITGDLPENINFAIKTGAIRDFLDNSAVPYQMAEPKAELKTAEIARNARAYTMFISCSAKSKE